ncbi:myocardin isoform X2 [Latimeria chalumnae]|uniref:myocardin isoform X2 n=1 Tax=Latimeria chalumnae TaxID=7897 RepID=UPI00313E6CC1
MTLLASERSMLIRSKFRSVLQLRMQHRRNQEQLSEATIRPALEKEHVSFPEHNHSSLERPRIPEFPKQRKGSRSHQLESGKSPFTEDPSTLMADPTELKQKKARLAEDLNEKILHRPGPLELVEKNIFPLNSSIKDAMKGRIPFPQSSESFTFDDDISSSSASSSPEQPGSHQSQGFTVSSPGLPIDQSAPSSNASFQSPPKSSEGSKNQRHKKPKEPKPKVKKLKYHQYVPPDQKAEKAPVVMDAAYSRLLQQQQVFLQLQILNQQQSQHHQTYCLKPLTASVSADHVISFGSTTPTCTPAATLPAVTTPPPTPKPELLPANLDDLTVSELRQQLRKRGLPVSGTKPALLERLKPYQIPRAKPPPAPIPSCNLIGPVFELPPVSAFPPHAVLNSSPTALSSFGLTVPTPSLSPASSELTLVDADSGKSRPEIMEVSSVPAELGPCATTEEKEGLLGNSAATGTKGLSSEDEVLLGPGEDTILLEKQKIIDSLTWKLQQEQRQAEDLRVELEMQKRLKNRHKMEQPLGSSGTLLPLAAFSGAETPPADAAGFLNITAPMEISTSQFFNLGNEGSETQRKVEEMRSASTEPSTDQQLSSTITSPPSQSEFSSFFSLQGADARREGRLEMEPFQAEVFCPPSCDSIGQDFELPMQITASPPESSPRSRTLEEELQEAIQKAQLAPSQSIEDILEEPILCSDEKSNLDSQFPESLGVSSSSVLLPVERRPSPARTPSPGTQQDNKPCGSCSPDTGRPMILEFLPASSSSSSSSSSTQFDIFNPSDAGFCVSFSPSPDCVEMPPSPPESLSKRPGHTRMTFDPVDWLEAVTSSSTSGLGPGSPVGPSIFSTDFLDSPDLNVNRMIDLMAEQW